MSESKVYPSSEPREYYKRGHSRHLYKSAASTILTQTEVSHIELLVDILMANIDEKFEGELDDIMTVIRVGENRMAKLHDVLGAFDLESDGKLTKPDSQKIDWSHLDDEPPKANLKVVEP